MYIAKVVTCSYTFIKCWVKPHVLSFEGLSNSRREVGDPCFARCRGYGGSQDPRQAQHFDLCLPVLQLLQSPPSQWEHIIVSLFYEFICVIYSLYYILWSPVGGLKRPAEGSKEEPSEKKNLPVVAKNFVSRNAIENHILSKHPGQSSPKSPRDTAQVRLSGFWTEAVYTVVY